MVNGGLGKRGAAVKPQQCGFRNAERVAVIPRKPVLCGTDYIERRGPVSVIKFTLGIAVAVCADRAACGVAAF